MSKQLWWSFLILQKKLFEKFKSSMFWLWIMKEQKVMVAEINKASRVLVWSQLVVKARCDVPSDS